MCALLTKLEDFRLLPYFVVFSMAAGILISNALVRAGDLPATAGAPA
jgi:hypothetical protein